ncbi:MAG: glycine zipper domain-containing protein [Phenylobacterium sp.]
MTKIAKVAMACAAAAATLTVSVPTHASAQGYSYDPCRREQTNRGTVGALVGGALGAAVGSNAAARKNRTEGALLGGAVGAVAGAAVGNHSAACGSAAYGPGYGPTYSYDDRPGYYGQGYSNRPYDLEDRYRASGYYDNGYADDGDYGYAYGYGGQPLRIAQRAGPDGCTLAESPVYMPDGRTVTRMVRVCRDSRGRYQVVD